MTDEGVLLDRSAIEDAFRRLGDRLARRGQWSTTVAELLATLMLSSTRMVSCSKRRMPWRRNWAFRSGG